MFIWHIPAHYCKTRQNRRCAHDLWLSIDLSHQAAVQKPIKPRYPQTERLSYPLFREFFGLLDSALPAATVTLRVVHNTATLEDKLPDFVACARNRSNLPFYFELVGEAKDEVRLNSGHLQQLEKYALLVFRHQPLRPFLYVFVATCTHVIFARFERPQDGNLSRPEGRGPFLRFTRTPVLEWEDGVPVLARLLVSANEDRGTVHEVPELLIDSQTVAAEGYLGCGRTATVYRATFNGQPAALKCYRAEFRNSMQNENDFLTELAATPAAVLRVVFYAPVQRMLMLQPVAVPLSQLRNANTLPLKDACMYPPFCWCFVATHRLQAASVCSWQSCWST